VVVDGDGLYGVVDFGDGVDVFVVEDVVWCYGWYVVFEDV